MQKSGNRFALLIACDQDGKDNQLPPLNAPLYDVEKLEDVLANPAIGNYGVETLLNKSSEEIKETLDRFFADRRRDDLLLLYFSCHGYKDMKGELYFATIDKENDSLWRTAIKANDVNELMRNCRARGQVLILDCCYSGAFSKGMTVKTAGGSVGLGEQFGRSRGRIILTATDDIRISQEDKIDGQETLSVYTRHLVKGLETGEADRDQDGYIFQLMNCIIMWLIVWT